jgi:hypothetical protein
VAIKHVKAPKSNRLYLDAAKARTNAESQIAAGFEALKTKQNAERSPQSKLVVGAKVL